MNITIRRMNGGKARIGAGLAAMAALSGVMLADAAVAYEPLTAVVSYADLNLDKQAGAAKMYQRLRGAARRVCAPLEGRHGVEMQLRECVDEAVARAVAQIDRPALTSLHRSKQSQPDTRVVSAGE